MTNASTYCQSLAATNTVTLPSGQPAGVTFNCVAGGSGIAVFSVNGNSLFQNNLVQQMSINMNGREHHRRDQRPRARTSRANGGNMVGGFTVANASKIIWNSPGDDAEYRPPLLRAISRERDDE